MHLQVRLNSVSYMSMSVNLSEMLQLFPSCHYFFRLHHEGEFPLQRDATVTQVTRLRHRLSTSSTNIFCLKYVEATSCLVGSHSPVSSAGDHKLVTSLFELVGGI